MAAVDTLAPAPPRAGPGLALPRLTSLRAVAALAVFATHASTWGVIALPPGLARLADLGHTGVTFFFVLSGFILTWSARPGTHVLTFYRRRFARVWPSHAVVLAAAAVVPVVAVSRSWESLVPNALLLQAWLPLEQAYSFNGVAWSLSCEAFFYALFPLALWASARLRTRTAVALVGGTLVLAVAAAVVAPGAALHVPLLRLPEFLVGVLVGAAFRSGWRPRVPPLAAVGALVVACALAAPLPRPLPDFALLVPFVLVLLSAAQRDASGLGGWLVRRPLVWAGEVSFAFYLVHELAILNLRGLTGSGWVACGTLLAMATALAALLHHAVERPCNRWLR